MWYTRLSWCRMSPAATKKSDEWDRGTTLKIVGTAPKLNPTILFVVTT